VAIAVLREGRHSTDDDVVGGCDLLDEQCLERQCGATD